MADKQALIDGLNEDLNLELEAVLRYLYHAAAATGLLGHELREMAKEEAAGELQHAAFLADKIAALGGEPDINPRPPRKLKSAKEMLQDDVAAERQVIENYRRHISLAEELGETGLVIRLEDMLAEETDHAEELKRLAR